MQARIKRLVADRSQALAAVSHDLRTPLTRLRLPAELVKDEKLRDQMAADLDAMATMSEDALVLGCRISIAGQAKSLHRL